MHDADAIRETSSFAAARLAAIVESSDDAILSKTLDGTITSWNRAAETLYGYTEDEVMGRHVSLLAPPGREQEMEAILEAIAAGQRIEHMDTQRVRRDGSLVDISVTVSPIRGPTGAVVGASTIARDIGERKRTEAALARHVEELERSNRELERFAYVVSHDLTEPLRAITGYLQLLAEDYGGKLGDEADEYIRFAVDGARRMKALLADLLTYARAGTEQLDLGPVDTGELVEQSLATLVDVVDESGAAVVTAGLPVVFGDAIKLGQVFQNVLANALKFRAPGRGPEIRVGAERAGDAWTFTIADNGIGIEPRHAQRVFEMFQRLHTTDEYPGTGVGLAICRRVVERHRGRIWIEPAPEGGTQVRFTIPDSPE